MCNWNKNLAKNLNLAINIINTHVSIKLLSTERVNYKNKVF